MSFTNREYSITSDGYNLFLSITSGEIYSWNINSTIYSQVIGSASPSIFTIGPSFNENIELDYTLSITPSNTAPDLKSYIDSINLSLDNSINGIVGVTGTIDGILGVTQTGDFDVSGLLGVTQIEDFTINGILGVTQTGDFDVSGLLGVTQIEDFTINGFVGITQSGNDELVIEGGITFNQLIETNQPSLLVRTGDWGLDVAMGLFTGITYVIVKGYNYDVENNSNVDVWYNGPTTNNYTFLTTPSLLRLDGNNGGDISSGEGARQVVIEGLDASFNFITDTLTTNGTGQSSNSSNSYIRLNNAFVLNTGTYHGANEDFINIETTGNVVIGTIGGGYGQNNSTHNPSWGSGCLWNGLYTIPANKTGYVKSIYASCHKEAGNATGTRVSLWKYENADITTLPTNSRDCVWMSGPVTSQISYTFPIPIKIPEKTDVWTRAHNDNNNDDAQVLTFITLIIKDN